MKLISRLVPAVVMTMFPVLFGGFAGECRAQSSNDPNRPPSAQNSLRTIPQRAVSSAAQNPSPDGPSGAEKILFDQLNESRVLAGLSALRWDANLAAAARKHCALMVQHEALSHQFPGEAGLQQRLNEAGEELSVAAENVAMAQTAEEIHYEWMHSPPHRANILDPQLTAVGIATLQGSKGIYAVQDFALAFEKMTLGEQEEKIRELINAMGVRTADNLERTQWSDARKTCQMPSGFVGKATYVVRFETADLSKLPAGLQKPLASKKYDSSAVGACSPPNDGTGFTHFRFAVLLY
jgi:uncharacterized protein YkwD